VVPPGDEDPAVTARTLAPHFTRRYIRTSASPQAAFYHFTRVARCFFLVTTKCDGFHCKLSRKFIYATLFIFGNSTQLQRHDRVHLSSAYTDYNFSSLLDIFSDRNVNMTELPSKQGQKRHLSGPLRVWSMQYCPQQATRHHSSESIGVAKTANYVFISGQRTV